MDHSIQIAETQISVNGVSIAADAVSAEMQYHPADSREEACFKAARALVVRELLLQEAARHGIEAQAGVSDSETVEEARIRQLMEQEVDCPQADAADCRRYFENNRPRFTTSPLVEARHILLPALADDLEGRRAAAEQAGQLISQLEADPSKFAQLAADYSACPSASEGGRLGQITRGQTSPEFERQVFALPAGLSRRPVETRYGYHVIFVDQRVDGQPAEFDQVRESIAAYLNERVRRKATSQYIGYLLDNATISGIQLDGDDTNIMGTTEIPQ